MNVLIINGSPRGANGYTYQVCVPFIQGMEKAGAKTEIINLGDLKINSCGGCCACWFVTPGKCIINDDMQKIYPKLIMADLIVYATPVYVYSMTGLMKNFLDRKIPLVLPTAEADTNNADLTAHPRRYSGREVSIFLLSVCAFPEFKHFSSLVTTFKHIAESTRAKYLGEILRPASMLLKNEKFKSKIADYNNLLRKAGEELILDKKINSELQASLHESWINAEDFRGIFNEQMSGLVKE